MSNSDPMDRFRPDSFLRPHLLGFTERVGLPLEAIPDLLLLHDCEGTCLAAHVPPGFPLLTGGDLVGQNVLSLFPWHCSQEDLSFYSWIDSSKEAQVIERVLPNSPSHRFFEIRILPVPPGKLLSIAREVTQRREREDELRAALRHKDTLLKELHHRVKNNLQVMISLLGLQSSCVQDPQARELAKESERRVRSMAIVHNYLDTSREDGQINLARYLRGVVDELFHAFGVERQRIVPVFDIQPIELRWELATNLGLIVNELVSNALKYAFPAATSGKLEIHLSQSNEGGLQLVVADDGCGFTSGMPDLGSTSIGLQLVTTLVEQLDGHIQIASNRGTRVTIVFPAEAPSFRGQR